MRSRTRRAAISVTAPKPPQPAAVTVAITAPPGGAVPRRNQRGSSPLVLWPRESLESAKEVEVYELYHVGLC